MISLSCEYFQGIGIGLQCEHSTRIAAFSLLQYASAMQALEPGRRGPPPDAPFSAAWEHALNCAF
jgi:hypothetical protein